MGSHNSVDQKLFVSGKKVKNFRICFEIHLIQFFLYEVLSRDNISYKNPIIMYI